MNPTRMDILNLPMCSSSLQTSTLTSMMATASPHYESLSAVSQCSVLFSIENSFLHWEVDRVVAISTIVNKRSCFVKPHNVVVCLLKLDCQHTRFLSSYQQPHIVFHCNCEKKNLQWDVKKHVTLCLYFIYIVCVDFTMFMLTIPCHRLFSCISCSMNSYDKGGSSFIQVVVLSGLILFACFQMQVYMQPIFLEKLIVKVSQHPK